jgi:hypothetical protein
MHAAKSVFAWDCLGDHPSLKTIQTLHEVFPVATLRDAPRRARGKGRNE